MRKIILEKDKKEKSFTQKIGENPKVLKCACLGIFFFLAVFSFEIWVVNRMSTYGDKIYQLKEAESKLELENQVIANSIAKDSSMVNLENKAVQFGFNNISQIEYIKTLDKLASAK